MFDVLFGIAGGSPFTDTNWDRLSSGRRTITETYLGACESQKNLVKL